MDFYVSEKNKWFLLDIVATVVHKYIGKRNIVNLEASKFIDCFMSLT